MPHLRHTTCWIGLAAAILIAACTQRSSPPTGALTAYTGTLQSSCSPVDAMALALDLEADAPGGPPRLSFLLWPPGDFQAGAVIHLSAASGPTASAMWPGETEWRLAEEGRLWVDVYQPAGAAGGRFQLDFDGDRSLEGSFQAGWVDPGPFFCG